MAELFSEISKPVISRADSSVCGVVKDAYFDASCKKIVYFVVGDSACDSDAAPGLLPFDSVASDGDALMIDSADCLCELPALQGDMICALIGKPVYTLSGSFKGNVINARFMSGGKVSKLCTETTEFSPSVIAGIGDAVLLKSMPKTAKNPRVPRPVREQKVEIFSSPDGADAAYDDGIYDPSVDNSSYSSDFTGGAGDNSNGSSPAPQSYSLLAAGTIGATSPVRALPAVALNSGEPAFTQDALGMLLGDNVPASTEADAHTPTRIICDYEFLLGRTLGADLNTYGGQLIAPKGSEVTAAVVEKARCAGKLVELTLSSIKK